MASFADNMDFMARLPCHACNFLKSRITKIFVWFVQTFMFCLLSKPQEVSNVRVRKVTSTSCEVTWKSQTSSICNRVSYEIQLKVDEDNSTWEQAGAASNTRTFKIDKLQPDMKYLVRVCAKNAGGTGSYSESVSAQTKRLPSAKNGTTGPLDTGEIYSWSQDLKHVFISFQLPQGMTSRQLDVQYGVDTISISNKITKAIILQGKTRNKLDPSGCVWSRDPDSGLVLVDLQKKFAIGQQPYLWSAVLRGHPQIDCAAPVQQ